MQKLNKVWDVIEKNRWTTLIPTAGVILWLFVSFSCVPKTDSPVGGGVKVDAKGLQQQYETWIANNEITAKKFQWAAEDIEEQQAKWNKLTAVLMTVASGKVTSWQGLLNILLGSGVLGIGVDNVRKNGVIAGLKRNKDTNNQRSDNGENT